MQSLEDSNIITVFRHISCKGKSCRAGTDDGNLDTVLFLDFRNGDLPAFALIVGGKALQIADSYRLFLHLQVDTFSFALLLLRTNAAANSRQGTGFFQCLGSFKNFSAFYVLDEAGNVDTYGAAFHTARIGTVQTALGFCQCLFLGQSLVHFFLAAV